MLAPLCVAKLVSFDMGYLDSLVRVASFMASGIICFAISALYNFAVAGQFGIV